VSKDLTELESLFPKGLLRPELFIGAVSTVAAHSVRINLINAGTPSGAHFDGGRYGKGEVGEFVVIEGQVNLLLARVVEVRLPESERQSITNAQGALNLDAIATCQLLGSVEMDTLFVSPGVEAYPRLGDRVYAAPHRFVALLPSLMDAKTDDKKPVTLSLGAVDVAVESKVRIKPEKLFGRHCAIVGATGGGKSWTTARIIEECLKHKSKMILLDATGEYRSIEDPNVVHTHIGAPVAAAKGSVEHAIPPACFVETDFIALFDPAGKVQGPKLRAAIRSLRLAKLDATVATNGVLVKIDQSKAKFLAAMKKAGVTDKIEDPAQEFDVTKLVAQIEQECVWPDAFGAYKGAPKDTTKWGSDTGDFSYCLSLVSRIEGVLASQSFKAVFSSAAVKITKAIEDFLQGDKRLLRICLSGVSYEYRAREIIANVIGRHILNKARAGAFKNKPLILFVDEAHNFLGRQIGSEDAISRLDAFEIIAKEGRKYGLNLCLASQRPRDITEGVLSQMGTLIVHRLTNDKDREVVERACGEIDRSASAFLPSLKSGEAAIIGVDFPIPMTIQIDPPTQQPISEGPQYQNDWRLP